MKGNIPAYYLVCTIRTKSYMTTLVTYNIYYTYNKKLYDYTSRVQKLLRDTWQIQTCRMKKFILFFIHSIDGNSLPHVRPMKEKRSYKTV